jgi:asparagine synthase (glutamine-hydrolysing)
MSKITIEREKTGKTPLFYCVYNNQFFYSANIKELLEISKLKPRIDAEGVAAITLLGPGRPLHNAVFAGVKELPPGYRAEFEDSKLTITQYWKPQAKEHTQSFEETSRFVRELITGCVKQVLGDNPCLFLSGGLDSSIIGTVMKQAGGAVTSYSVDYIGNSGNFKAGAFQPTEDAPFVEEMQQFLKSEHHRIFLNTDDLFDSLYGSVIARGLPGMADVDGAMYLFCGLVRQKFASALSGECADETGCIRWG